MSAKVERQRSGRRFDKAGGRRIQPGRSIDGRGRGGGQGRDGGHSVKSVGKSKAWRNAEDALEARLGFDVFSEGEPRLGWLLNFSPSSIEEQDNMSQTFSCVNLYFMCQDGSTFKAQVKFAPYFYVRTKERMEVEVDAYLRRRFQGVIAEIQLVNKEDLSLKNHLSGIQRTYLKVSFNTVQDLMQVKFDLLPVVDRNQAKLGAAEAYEALFHDTSTNTDKAKVHDYSENIIDLREFDVPYHARFAIDSDVRCGQWFNVSVEAGKVKLEKRSDLLQRAEVRVCAFDIETTKLPLKFPDASFDSVMMISYMLDNQGYLIINRECVGQDIEDLEYTPKPEFEGFFKVTNCQTEKDLLQNWFSHMREVKPQIYVTYNGDFFDWPFLEQRAKHHGMNMHDEIGFRCDEEQGECVSKFACHLDCFAWVKRDSYLPQGSQGLKAVTKAKLGYDPLEVNPEDMVRFAIEQPQKMASYSVSDAVATYFLYMTYVHPFIFSLATILPMPPDEVLRKGSGTLCEMLLMVQAFKGNIICPNKHKSKHEVFYNGRLLESETYIGGHVECLESGVFRSDLPTRFRLAPEAYQMLVDNLDRDLHYAIEKEGKLEVASIANYEDVKKDIKKQLEALRDIPNREERPIIYHLDVAAMYPNIILTNRLQPPSIVTDDICAACDFNRPDKKCLRQMEWVWRGETYTAKRSEYYHLKNQIESEWFATSDGQTGQYFRDLSKDEQESKLKDRLKKYCQKVYKRVIDKPTTERRTTGVCMRENPFYVDTVRSFRDRRYEYKGLNKTWKGKYFEAKASGNPIKIQEAQDMVVLYDSLQLAHKCILNSFYGYVMRKGARWYSMEMAGVVTYTGAKIIQNARVLVDQIGKPLELDTDGIWCALPASFPENFVFVTKDTRKKFTISYPCVMLNVDVALNNTNNQYQTLADPIHRTYNISSECSIEFEVDGPYRAMILPASKEEGVLIKKRYAVFNDDGTLAELKGFEVKRRGELKLIKVFQAEVFEKFLLGETLEECYAAVASVADRWIDMLENQGIDLADSELLDYISESSTMSKSLADYGEAKSCATTTARRLADFLGDAMVKDKGLSCRYIVARNPQGAPVSERAIPVAIFETESDVMKAYIRKWCKVTSDVLIRSIVDWAYYRQRLNSAIQKIITIPAAMQKVANPVPRVPHPDWLWKKVREKNDKHRQRSILSIFNSKVPVPDRQEVQLLDSGVMNHTDYVRDVEDIVQKECVDKDIQVHSGLKYFRPGGDIEQKQGRKVLLQDDQIDTAPNRMKTPDRVDHFDEWLKYKKRKWKEIIEKRKRLRQGSGLELGENNFDTRRKSTINGHTHERSKKSVRMFFRDKEAALTHSHWQILQLLPTQKLGEFTAWVVAGGGMFKLIIKIPRVFYLNAQTLSPESYPGKPAVRVLPHGHQCLNLFEVTVEEEQFKAAGRKLAAHLSDPEVEGVYETKMQLGLQGVLQLGCVCVVDPKARSHNLKDAWLLENLHMKTTTECKYLSDSISFMYLYHSSSDTRGIYAFYAPIANSVLLIIVNPFSNKEISAAQVERYLRDSVQVYQGSKGDKILDHSNLSFKVEYLTNNLEAGKHLQRIMNEYRNQHPGPAIAMIECPSVSVITKCVSTLAEFPFIVIPSNERDSQYQALGWQPVAAKLAMQRCGASIIWLDERIRLSRYAHVPLGNFDFDWLLFTVDVFYARALRDHQQVLWISDNGIPDLGGMPEDEPSFADEVQQPVLSYPGAYRSVTVELKVNHLAVNALLKSSQINEIEGGVLLGFELDSKGNPQELEKNIWDESFLCAPAFRVLKQMVQGWVSDAVSCQNIFADALLQHLYRWLCSPLSKLHDPALHRILHKVMQKVFALLLAELRKLGATIVFANFSRIIIATGKHNKIAAQGYCTYLIKTLQTRDLFEWIQLEPQRFWHSLLFMDQFNYGGIQAKVSETMKHVQQLDPSNDVQEFPDNALSQPDIVSSWNIAEYLPKSIQEYFIVIVSEFIYIPWKYSQEQAAKRAASRLEGDFCTPSVTIAAATDMQAEEVKFLKEQIESYFTDKLLRIVRDVQRHFKARIQESMSEPQRTQEFPKLAGSHLPMGDAALEFIKHVCAVLSLDQHVQHAVQVMRKNLLKLVQVREFSKESQFCDPCLSFTLPNVICSYCNDCRDLDLCRDAALLERDWRCAVPQCGQPYNREWIENALLQIMRQRERLYHLQDLICSKCRQVKASHLQEQCGCGGAYKCSEDITNFNQRIKVFHNIAAYHGFELLEECAAWILESSFSTSAL